jgi:hypothetical protein
MRRHSARDGISDGISHSGTTSDNTMNNGEINASLGHTNDLKFSTTSLFLKRNVIFHVKGLTDMISFRATTTFQLTTLEKGGIHSSFDSVEFSSEFLEGSGETGLALLDGVSKITRPCDQLLKEILQTLQEGEACFEGLMCATIRFQSVRNIVRVRQETTFLSTRAYLDEDPESGTQTSEGPCNEEEKNKPEEGEDRIGGHGCVCLTRGEFSFLCLVGNEHMVPPRGAPNSLGIKDPAVPE